MPGPAPAFLHNVTKTDYDTIFILCVVKWIKVFPQQARGKLFEVCGATTVFTIMMSLTDEA